MKVCPPNLAFLLLLPSAHGFGVQRLPSGTVGRQSTTSLNSILSKRITEKLPRVFKDVHLPLDQPLPPKLADLLNLNLFSNKKTVSYIFGTDNKGIIGEKKTDESLYEAQSFLENNANLSENIVSPDYKFFGSPSNRAEELVVLLKTNPFMASALTAAPDGGFELKSFDPNENNKSRYLQYMDTLNGVGHRVNFKFDKDMKIESLVVFDDLEGNPLEGAMDKDFWASSAIYNLVFYASSVHATIHVLHFLLTSALVSASSEAQFDALEEWADYYEKNIAVKYLEVGALLITDPPKEDSEDLDLAIITGAAGFGSSQAIRPMLKSMLDEWGKNPSVKGWMERMYNIPVDEMEKAGILTEFRKHADLVPGYAAAVKAAMVDTDKRKTSKAENHLEQYLSKCGEFKSEIKTIDQWVEIMAITGITHGGTLSYTRLLGGADVMKWRHFTSPVWEKADENLITGGLGTVTGMQPGRHVMTEKGGGCLGYCSQPLKDALKEYDEKTTNLKRDYENWFLDQKKDVRDNVGFILSDFCTDNFDGKQLTITTYI